MCFGVFWLSNLSVAAILIGFFGTSHVSSGYGLEPRKFRTNLSFGHMGVFFHCPKVNCHLFVVHLHQHLLNRDVWLPSWPSTPLSAPDQNRPIFLFSTFFCILDCSSNCKKTMKNNVNTYRFSLTVFSYSSFLFWGSNDWFLLLNSRMIS